MLPQVTRDAVLCADKGREGRSPVSTGCMVAHCKKLSIAWSEEKGRQEKAESGPFPTIYTLLITPYICLCPLTYTLGLWGPVIKLVPIPSQS